MAKVPEPSEWEALFVWAQKLLGFELPPLVLTIIGAVLLICILVAMLLALGTAFVKLKTLVLEHIVPKSYRKEQLLKVRARRQFAQYVRSEIEKLNRSENWRDDEFTELEAEVEFDGERLGWRNYFRRSGISREASLSRALAKSADRLILLEGDPGSGKSVALRHVAHAVAHKASKTRRENCTVPVYVNLKEIKRGPDQDINYDLIKSYVIASLKRVNDRFVDEYVDREFDNGLSNGNWLFLFDSFDEIPDILSSTDTDVLISKYSEAISDFFHGANGCRGIIASRHYRGPQSQSWTVFRVMPLSWKRQRDLISKSLINKYHAVVEIESGLVNATDDVKIMARNPMLLGLLCEHVKLNNSFPQSAFEVFSKYINYRINRDADRVRSRFGIESGQLNNYAELIAFCMTADSGIGLSPTISQIIGAIRNPPNPIEKDELVKSIHALSYMRLGRLSEERSEDTQTFSFSHRRFQEYLATQVVLKDTNAVSAEQLLVDGRWRETAVVLLQNSSQNTATPILAAAEQILRNARELLGEGTVSATSSNNSKFRWRDRELHILGIVQNGRNGVKWDMPSGLLNFIDSRLSDACKANNLLDKKLALEVAGAGSESSLVDLMKAALTTRSRWISDIVYRQAARLANPVDPIYREIRRYIARLVVERRIQAEYHSTKAFLARLPESNSLTSALGLARLLPLVEVWSFPALLGLSSILGGLDIKDAAVLSLIHFISFLYPKSSTFGTAPIVYFRVSLAVVAGLFSGQFNHVEFVDVRQSKVMLAIVGIYLQAISPSGRFCISNNETSNRAFLPFLPILALVHSIVALYKHPIEKLVVFAVSLLVVILAVVSIWMTDVFGFLSYLEAFISYFSVLLSIVMIAGGVLLLLHEISIYRRWKKNQKNVLTVDDFNHAISLLRTSTFRVKIIKTVSSDPREKDRTHWIRSIEAALKNLGADSSGFGEPLGIPAQRRRIRMRIAAKKGGYINNTMLFLLEVSYPFLQVFEKESLFEERDLLYSWLERETLIAR